jgi:DNA-binding NarL/FixJ family response regulator
MRDIEEILLELRAALERLESGRMQTAKRYSDGSWIDTTQDNISNAGVRSYGGARLSPHANCDVEDGRLVLIEKQLLLRENLEHALATRMPGMLIDGVADSGTIPPGPARLVLLGINPRSSLDVGALRFTVETVRAQCDDPPIAAVLHDDDSALVKTLLTLGVVGIIRYTASLAITIAAVRLMMVGGVYLPPETMCEQSLSLAAQRTQQSDNCAPQPEMSELGVDSHAETTLTARERDVLEILRKGLQNKRIAYDLGISQNTVKVHLRNIMKKLHASNRTQVALGAGAMAKVLSC